MEPCRIDNLSTWFESQTKSLEDESLRRILLEVNANLDSFVKWPKHAVLLWEGCHRMKEAGQRQKYHSYPLALIETLPEHCFKDRRSNGPAIVAFAVGGGTRPLRSNGRGWNIHHLYDGKFAYTGATNPSMHAVKEPRHFTQSAGLIAVHPLADALADEFAIFAWRLRAESFRRFGYDPEGAFTHTRDGYGFYGRTCRKIWPSDVGCEPDQLVDGKEA